MKRGRKIGLEIFYRIYQVTDEETRLKRIEDYKFEVIEIVPVNENLLEREKYWIQKLYLENPDKSLNIACTAKL